ncbi:L-ascorbate metabolism protein UlaG (beta-lactamase superfamily) [Mucilaginibacter gracilis]|uniref:L-ascorbate metabolism protein UlaG (Beta-lactamase superfamily) n=1 Tax=Mucilaginibacter gracilis TaxID=423350 RepID=A0A495J7F4_9SPHI|nr:MBL fold metallo-hydrolase [Mucilaginibacter gracilis]RKR84926.1 L-ascorbate metabolism protein UlaG (beta-lactamase superfamily) [Mucilaginibacter gracilis]
MKITKYIHSCLVFEQNNFKLLVDPGNYTFADGLLSADDFADVSAILITHIHADHLDMDNIKKIIALSNAPVFGNKQVAQALQKEGINAILFTDGVRMFGQMEFKAMPIIHMPLLDSPIPEMTGYVINGNILHSVDSMDASLTQIAGIDLLILPIMAPFCNELQVTQFADALKPKHILPVHDGYAKAFFVKLRSQTYLKHFEARGITFLQPPEAHISNGTTVVFKFAI